MITYPDITNPQINSFVYEQPTNNQHSEQFLYTLDSREDVQQKRVAQVDFIFTPYECIVFLDWFYNTLQKGLKSFTTDWKDFEEVFFTIDSELKITKNGESYNISGLKIETVKSFKGGA